jgi:hypothetical protein
VKAHSPRCGSKNSFDFLEKGMREGSKEIQKAQVVRVEAGSCSVNANRVIKFLLWIWCLTWEMSSQRSNFWLSIMRL